ncbi:MAG: cytochrome c family protein [Alphaproteobacteria bacterium]
MRIVGIATLAAALAAPTVALADMDAGRKVYKKCVACHFVDKQQNKVGPHLVDLFGRKAGALEGFAYSKAMQDYGVIWDATTLDAYLEAPRKVVPGTKMAFAGLRKAEESAALIEYLKESTKPAGG